MQDSAEHVPYTDDLDTPVKAGRPGAEPPGRGVLAGAFELLEALADLGVAGLSELAREAHLPKTTALRLLGQLVELRIVLAERDERNRIRYQIGAGLQRLTRPERPFQWLRAAGADICLSVAKATGANVALATLHGQEMLAVTTACVTGSPILTPGRAPFPSSTAAGRIILAEQPGHDVPDAFTDTEWRRIRATVREQGAAFDHQEVVTGICCVAAPVRTGDGRVVAALTALVVAERIPPGLPDIVRRAATQTGRHLPRSVPCVPRRPTS